MLTPPVLDPFARQWFWMGWLYIMVPAICLWAVGEFAGLAHGFGVNLAKWALGSRLLRQYVGEVAPEEEARPPPAVLAEGPSPVKTGDATLPPAEEDGL